VKCWVTGLIKPRSIGVHPGLPVYYAYTLAGTGEEYWTPRFSYCGCRYLQVEGAAPAGRAAPGTPEIIELANEFIHADVEQTGDFTCSQTLLMQIHALIKQAVLSNTVSVFTDCPHREKLGWLEQDHLNAATLLYNEDVVTLFEKTVSDIVDAQLPSGQIPEIAPEYVQFLGPDEIYRDSPEWGGTIVLGAWATYRFYGDDRILAIGYPAMRRYADYLETKRGADGIIAYGLGDWLDIGPHKNGGVSQLTTLGLTATGTYYEMLTALVEIARILGRPTAELADYRRRAASVKTAFNTRFLRTDQGSYDTGSQTANAMPLAVGLVPSSREADVLAKLVADIHARQYHVTAGDVGFHYVVRALMGHGRGDLLHAMLSRTDPPSYGAQVMAGATALTENWDPADGGSQNHFMLGHAEQWLFEGLAGIGVDFSRSGPAIRISPQPMLGMDSAGARYRSAIGPIGSRWQRQGQGLTIEVDIPPGATACVCLPGPVAAIREGGGPAAGAPGVTAARDTPEGAVFTVGSGRYRFETARS
jgi:alpha-L-rhamnosidase